MERQVKERLVGAAVLMAAAIILIPEMLSGPKREGRTPAVETSGDAPLKTYTIDLNRSPGSPQAAVVEEHAPPPETTPSDAPSSGADNPAESQVTPENQATAHQTSPETDERAADDPSERVAHEAAPRPSPSTTTQPSTPQPPPLLPRTTTAPTPEASAPTPIASARSAPISRGWAVQVGSFANRATADRLVKELSQQGQGAFVMPVKSGSSTLYRVRIGPYAERAAANDALREVKGRISNAAVVAHP